MIRTALAALLLFAAFPVLAQGAPPAGESVGRPQASTETPSSNCSGTDSTPGNVDHAINTKGCGTAGRMAINNKGTGSNNGRSAGASVTKDNQATTPANHAINNKGTGATANGRQPVKK